MFCLIYTLSVTAYWVISSDLSLFQVIIFLFSCCLICCLTCLLIFKFNSCIFLFLSSNYVFNLPNHFLFYSLLFLNSLLFCQTLYNLYIIILISELEIFPSIKCCNNVKDVRNQEEQKQGMV